MLSCSKYIFLTVSNNCRLSCSF